MQQQGEVAAGHSGATWLNRRNGMTIMSWLYILFALGIANGVIALMSIKQFLGSYSSIDSWPTLNRFKEMARQQMIQALVQIGVLVPMMIVGIGGVYKGKISGQNFVIWLLLNGGILGVGLIGKKYEELSRSLKVLDPNLEEQYKKICNSWVHKPLPDF